MENNSMEWNMGELLALTKLYLRHYTMVLYDLTHCVWMKYGRN